MDGGKMDGFAKEQGAACKSKTNCDSMGYHVKSDIPNYWAYAKHFTLDDHFFESDHSWSLPAHMYMVSAWSADCSNPANPMTCVGTDEPRNRTAAHLGSPQTEESPKGWPQTATMGWLRLHDEY